MNWSGNACLQSFVMIAPPDCENNEVTTIAFPDQGTFWTEATTVILLAQSCPNWYSPYLFIYLIDYRKYL